MPEGFFPSRFYRFRSAGTDYFFEEINEAITNRRIFLSPASFQNDPYEMSPEYIESNLAEVGRWVKEYEPKGSVDRTEFSRKIGRQVSRGEFRHKHRKVFKKPVDLARFNQKSARMMFRRLRSETLMASFSENLHSAPMWAHYSNNHAGFCIEYEIDSSGATGSDLLPIKVQYSRRRPIVTTLDVLNYARQRKPFDEDRIFSALALSKSEDWAYEREWRVFINDGCEAKYVRFGKLKVKRIILGAMFEEDVRKRLTSTYGDRCEFAQAKPSTSAYDFEVRTLGERQ